jgi:hypothetical protein
MSTKPTGPAPVRLTRGCHLAEVKLNVAVSQLSWISTSLEAACLRLGERSLRPHVLSVAYVSVDHRLACIVEAGCVEDVHRLFDVALLPSARVVGATVVALHPRARRMR